MQEAARCDTKHYRANQFRLPRRIRRANEQNLGAPVQHVRDCAKTSSTNTARGCFPSSENWPSISIQAHTASSKCDFPDASAKSSSMYGWKPTITRTSKCLSSAPNQWTGSKRVRFPYGEIRRQKVREKLLKTGLMAVSTQPLISVIVPVYNVERYLDQCVESLIGQTYERLEIILVDDGSTDSSGEQCNAWANRDNRIRAVRQCNAA